MSSEIWSRRILHADLDAFYASVEQRDDKRLRGTPVAVGGNAARGVIAAASYEARRFGVRSAMPTATALRLCPKLTVVPPRMSHYASISAHIFSIYRDLSPLVEPLSLDEAFIDLTGTEHLLGASDEVAQALRRRVRKETDLTVSVGLSFCKFVAKLASDLCKPNGLLVVSPSEAQEFLDPLPASRLAGVGRVTAETLRSLGVTTIADLRQLPPAVLRTRFRSQGDHLARLARGIDDRPVVADRPPKSIGQEDTFSADLNQQSRLEVIVQQQADRVAKRLRKKRLTTGTVVLKLKTPDFKTITRRRRLADRTSNGSTIGSAARDLLTTLLPQVGPLRLTGVMATDLHRISETAQLSFDQSERDAVDRLAQTIDQITTKFGEVAIQRADSLQHDD